MSPVIIVGAPRSGTNALRDALSSFEAFTTWPCDELNALWRTTNSDFPTDALPPRLATAAVKKTIHGAFARQQRKAPASIIVEKTCANTLRLPFVAEVFPQARFLEIVRDGRDATASTIRRWQAPFDLRYSLEKLRWVPRHDRARVIRSALSNRLLAQNRPEGASVNVWGPIWPDLDRLIASGSPVPTLAAHQWVACSLAADDYFGSDSSAPNPATHMRIRYEELTRTPAQTLERIVRWVAASASPHELEAAASTFHTNSIGSWQHDRATRHLIETELRAILEPANHRLGYDT